MLALALAAAATQPQPGRLRTFGDWAVGCDNVRACQAVALVPEGEDRDRYLLLVIRREGAGTARPVMRFSTVGPVTQALGFLRVDGRMVARPTGEPRPVDVALAAALGQGGRATLTDARGRVLASASLKGLAAAFLHMDERQHRLGTTGALIRRGPRPNTAVSAEPPLPRIVQPRPSSHPPRGIPAARAARLIGPDNARCPSPLDTDPPRTFRLDARHSIVVVEHPCGNGAYNIFSSVFVVDERGRVLPTRFDTPPGIDRGEGAQIVNGGWDPDTRRLGSGFKARGVADCGVMQSYAWDGTRFRMAERSEMGECRGSTDYITTWRAAVTTAR